VAEALATRVDYAAIPASKCRPGCSDCCGPHPWSKAEHARITAYLRKRGRKELRATGLTCPYVERHRCSIYPVRPFICRLYGTLAKLRCPHGRGPKRLLSPQQEAALMGQYLHELHAIEVAP